MVFLSLKFECGKIKTKGRDVNLNCLRNLEKEKLILVEGLLLRRAFGDS